MAKTIGLTSIKHFCMEKHLISPASISLKHIRTYSMKNMIQLDAFCTQDMEDNKNGHDIFL